MFLKRLFLKHVLRYVFQCSEFLLVRIFLNICLTICCLSILFLFSTFVRLLIAFQLFFTQSQCHNENHSKQMF